MKIWPVLTGVAIALTLVACKSPTPPKGVQPINNFDASRYLGKWYEVARLENRFERGLERVTATYGQRSDGGISVVNRGYDPRKQKWSESEGKAYFTAAPTTAALKVSFFGPFYLGDYWVLDHADDYSWSIVGEPSGRYLWLMSRTAKPSQEVRATILSRAAELGYDLALLHQTRHRP